jgi:hypothetical protein
VDAAVKQYGRIDVMLNNAGIMPQSLLDQLKVAEWDQMIDVNIKGVLYGIAAVLPVMKQQKSGHIINVSSVAGHRVGPGSSVYAATKFAVRAISEGLRQEEFAHDDYFAGSGCNRTSQYDHRRCGRGARKNPLRNRRNLPRLIRARCVFCNQPAGGRRYQRDPLQADEAGILGACGHVGHDFTKQCGFVASRADAAAGRGDSLHRVSGHRPGDAGTAAA